MDENTKVAKLQQIVEAGKEKVHNGLSSIIDEYKIRKDILANQNSVNFDYEDGIKIQMNGNRYGFTDFAGNQLLEKSHIPKIFFNNLIELGKLDLANDNLNELFKCQNELTLIRTVGDTVKGVLSPSYKRIDSAPIYEQFVKKSMDSGLVPYNGVMTDYRNHISFIFPDVKDVNGDAVCFGISLTTSDYGSKAIEIEFMILRIICSNLAIGSDIFRKVHIGRRIDDMGENIRILSNETLELDLKTIISAIADNIDFALTNFSKLEQIIIGAMNQTVTQTYWTDIKKSFGKDIFNQTKSLYDTPQIEQLPSGENLWRLSNALSLVAQNHKSDKQLDLQKAAFDIINKN